MFPQGCEFDSPVVVAPENDTWLCASLANPLFFFLLLHSVLHSPPVGVKVCLKTSFQYILLPVKIGIRAP